MLEILRKTFGHRELRPGQEEVVKALLAGRSALAVFPTGGGKSLCYQLPALIFEGMTLVVSPLIALMKDQVDALNARGISAARLDSSLDLEESRELYAKLDRGEVKLLYIAPERFSNEAFRQRVARWRIDLLAIDEAHCISEWGHNFRPDYLKLARVSRRLKIPRILALTATATPKVAREIRRHFRISAEDHVQLSFHRPNLDLRVSPCASAERKALLLDRLSGENGSTVVYVTRQETAEEIATFLNWQGLSARAYHAGLPDDFRSDAQSAFMAGEVKIIVATIAFGMGIDKSDIRRVVHYNLPKSLENYTQEIGRAGRDGLPAICELLACADDLTVLENFIHADTPSPGALGNLLDRILRRGAIFDVSLYDLSVTCDIRTTVIATVLTYLEIEGFIEATGGFYDLYQVKLLRDESRIVAGMAARDRKFFQTLLAAGEMKRMYLHFRPSELVDSLGVKREKIVAALGELEIVGEAAVKVSGIRQGYRLKKDPGDLRELAERLATKFLEREAADLDRLSAVLGISGQRGCLTAYLTRHFGENLDAPCGHCDRCRGVPARVLRRKKAREVTVEELERVRSLKAEKHAALGTPRQLARFLCGMSSPAATRARLSRHESFGLLKELPFAEVLVMARV
ncbi:MAG: ATP-dependent DNA helicase RecQ [Luteolibacter sp.]